jgi:hypothetical protein
MRPLADPKLNDIVHKSDAPTEKAEARSQEPEVRIKSWKPLLLFLSFWLLTPGFWLLF